MAEDIILDGLKDERVIAVKRITTLKYGQRRNTPLLILTFNTTHRPTEIHAGYIKYSVRIYIPNPLRCFRCQSFGHGSKVCRQEARCHKCGSPSHGENPCDAPVHCLHCNSTEHTCTSSQCPVWQTEKEICRLHATHNITFNDARKLYKENQSKTAISYASITRKSTKSIAIQTEPIPALPSLEHLKQQAKQHTITTQTTPPSLISEPVLQPYSSKNCSTHTQPTTRQTTRIPNEHNYSNPSTSSISTPKIHSKLAPQPRHPPDIDIISDEASASDENT